VSASSIISFLSYSNPAINYEPVRSSSQQQQPTQLPGTTTRDTEDLVHLSQFAQMALQGQSASVIAGATGLSVSAVDSALGVQTTSSSVTAAAPHGQGGEHPATPAATSDSKTATPAHTLSVFA
jgi:hypothetical protein